VRKAVDLNEELDSVRRSGQTTWAMSWTTPEMVEIKMDAEISSYQDDDYDPLKDGPQFVSARSVESDVSSAE
jgi:hypothetical protein